jgi:hypothetical protein
MATLTEDLDRSWNEAYTNKDIRAGIKLIGEFMGVVLLASTVFVGSSILLSTVLGPLGIGVSGAAVFHGIVKPFMKWYNELDSTERFFVRAAVNAFNPADHAALAAGVVGDVEEVTALVQFLQEALKVQRRAKAAANIVANASKAAKKFLSRS